MEEQTQTTGTPEPKKSMMPVIIVIVIILVAAGAYAMTMKKTDKASTTETEHAETMDHNTDSTKTTVPETQTTITTPEVTTPITTTPTADTKADVKSFTVEGSNFKFSTSEIKVKKGDTVKITFNNTGGFHDFVIDEFSGAKTKQIQGGSSETITFVADKTGTFEFYCSVGSHRQMGMKGKFIVE